MSYSTDIRNAIVIASNSNIPLAEKISENLKVKLITCTHTFANSEINIKFNESIRGYDVFIVGTGSSFDNRSINDHIMELLLMIDACRRSNANTITLIVACYPYARADKKDHRGPISSKLMADLFVNAGVSRIISVDLHSAQIQGFINEPFDNIFAINVIIDHLKKTLFTNMTNDEINEKYILASPDHGGIKRVEAYCKKLQMDHVTLHKQRDYTKMNVVMNSSLIGDKSKLVGKTVIMIDDMIDTAGTMIAGAKELVTNGAKNVILLATHGVLSGEALNKINSNEHVTKVYITDSINQENNTKLCSKLETITLSNLLSDVIVRLMTHQSVSELFN